MRRYALFTGCLIYQRVPHIEAVSVEVLKRLGVEFKRLDGFTCCPEPTTMRVLNKDAWYALAARNLAVAEEAGLDILTLCNGCNDTLFRVAEDLKADGSLRDKVNKVLAVVGRRFEGGVEVRSLLRVLHEDVGADAVKQAVERPMKGVKVAVHHGCHIYDELSHYDDVKRPRVFKDLLRALGCEVVDYPSEGLCCGAFIRPADEELSLSMVKEKIEQVKELGADCLAVICPTCLIQFDAGQVMASRKLGVTLDVPVFYLTQLIGLAMGMGLDEVGAKYHTIKPSRLAEKLLIKT